MAKLVKMHNGEVLEEFPITKPELRIGRASDNDIILHDDTVSSHHAVVSLSTGKDGSVEGYEIKGLQSTNKTFVNNKEIAEQALKDKDEVRVGFSHFEFDVNSSETTQKDFDQTTKIHKSWIPGVFYTKE